MSKIITFSRVFPAYHPKKGKPTYFVEQILKNIGINYFSDNYLQKLCELNLGNISKGKLFFRDIEKFHLSLQEKEDEKLHTIRRGNRFSSGDYFSPRCWFGKPYSSPQIIFWEDIEVKQTHKIERDKNGSFVVNGKHENIITIAHNDGLSGDDFLDWFPIENEFNGQIICWDDEVQY